MYTQNNSVLTCRNIYITSATQQKIVEFCDVSALYCLHSVVCGCFVSIPLFMTLSFLRRGSSEQVVIRGAPYVIVLSFAIRSQKVLTIRYVQRDVSMLLCFSRLLRLLNINFRDYNSRNHYVLLVRAIFRDNRMKPPI